MKSFWLNKSSPIVEKEKKKTIFSCWKEICSAVNAIKIKGGFSKNDCKETSWWDLSKYLER